MSQLQRGFAEAAVVYVRGMGDLRGFVVADFGSQRGYQHQRVLDVPVDFRAIDFDAFDHVLDVAVAGVCNQRDRLQEVVNDDWLEDVKFEVALGAGESDGGSCSVDLHADHSHGFALRGVDFAGHDGRSRLVFWDGDFSQSAARAGSQPANVVGNLHE